jgi:LmbE family N-acetylglucosaminyl deacetylase
VSAPVIDLTHAGTSAEAWRAVVEAMEPFSIDPSVHLRLVVVAPHPDDETLGVGGLMSQAAVLDVPIVVVSVTDGEASSDQVGLAEIRQAELEAALRFTVPSGNCSIMRCGFADGRVATSRDELANILQDDVLAGDLVLAPLYCDGHPDHDAAGSAASTLADRDDIQLAYYPIWAWHWHEPSVSVISIAGHRVDLTVDDVDAKIRALGCFGSQTGGADPVLPQHFLGRFDASYEVVVPSLPPIR